MKHVRTITRKPARALGSIPADVLLAFIIDVLEAFVALFAAKGPSEG